MCPTEIGCGNEDKGKEDIEEDRAPDANMDDDEDTKVELKDPLFSLPERNQDEKSRDNVDLQTEINSSTGVGLQIDNHGSVVNQPDDDNNVDGIHGNNKDLKMDFVANEDKDSESVAANNAPVNAIAKEQASSKTDGSLGRPLSQVECIAAEERLSKREVENGEKGENLDDVSIVDASADGLSGSNNDGSPMDPLKRECAAANVRLSEIKDENYEMGEKLYDSLAVGASAEKVLISKNDGNLVDPLTQTECATADERPTEMKTVTDYKMDASVDVIATELHVSENDGIGSHAHMLNMAECAEADMSSSELKGRNNEKEEKLDLDVNGNKLPSSNNDGSHVHPSDNLDNTAANERLTGTIDEHGERGEKLNDGVTDMELTMESEVKELKPEVDAVCEVVKERTNLSFLFEPPVTEGNESGTEDEQAAFAKEVENFYKERNLEYKHPKFYKEDLNLLKLWRAVIQLGGYDEVTSCKLWRQVGESFNPPKTCTTVSWTFRIFYEKALLDYEKHRMSNGELPLGSGSLIEPSQTESQAAGSQSVGSGRARRDAAARAMQGWHSKRLLGSGEVCQPIIKEKTSSCTPKSDKQIKNIGVLKRKKPSSIERTIQVANMKATNSQSDTVVIDIGPPADWVKINVQRTVDCFEVYALVPGLLREEVHVQSDPAGRLVISGQPEQLDNPWGVTPFKKVVSLPSRIDPHQTSAVVTLHGQLFVRVPFEQSDM